MAENITDKQVVKTPPLRETDRFPLPPSLDVVVFEDRSLDNDPSYVSETGGQLGGDTGVVLPPLGLIPPNNIRIVEQIVRFRQDGMQVIDVVIEADPVNQATGYNIRMTPL